MSTYYYYRCLQHNPPVVCGTEVSQHDDQYVQNAIQYAQGIAPWAIKTDGYPVFFHEGYKYQYDEFLAAHEGCPMDIISEYGHDPKPIPGREKPDPKDMDPAAYWEMVSWQKTADKVLLRGALRKLVEESEAQEGAYRGVLHVEQIKPLLEEKNRERADP